MDRYGLRFHHLGLAVRRPDRAVRFLSGMGYRVGEEVFDPLQNVRLRFCEGGEMPDVELIYPADTPGPLDGILGQFDELIYHTCYTSRDAAASLEQIRGEHRVITVAPSKPAVLFGNRGVSFHKIAGFGIIEIIDEAGAER